MFLYASHRHGKAAKIASIALVINIVASLILMQPFGAMGLALAGSIGGWTLFILTLREVGVNHFIVIIKSKKSLYFSMVMILFGIILYFTNQQLISIIRG
jgi:putative peptidoglycan lipid II flippase